MFEICLFESKKKYALLRKEITRSTLYSDDIIRSYGYEPVSPLDIQNLKEIGCKEVECSTLYRSDERLVRFAYWLGHYPFPGVVIEEIGTIQNC